MDARSAVVASGLVVVLLVSCGDDDGGDGADSSAAPLKAARSAQPFVEPPRRQSSDGVLRFDLVARDRGVQVAGADVEGQAFDDGIVGPTLVVDPGDTIELTVDNRLGAHTNLHFHGMHVSPAGDGDNVFLSIHPGERFRYSLEIPEDHPPGTFWYHSHAHGSSEEQVFGGVSGMLVVDRLADLLPADLRDIDDIAIGLKDAQVVGDAIEREGIDSNAPTLRVVNSAHLPVQQIAPGEVQLWRLANIGADIWYDLALHEQPFVVVGEDGNPVWDVWEAEHLLLPPGKRFDVLVTGPPAGEYVLETRRYHQGDDTYPRTDLMTLVSGGAEVATPAMPQSLAPVGALPAGEVGQRRTMVFSEDERTNEFFVNDEAFDPDRVDVRPVLGTVEEWTLRNASGEQHPFHIHVNDFEVVSIGGEPYEARSVQDTVPVLPDQDVVIRTRFADFTGKFVFHCHILNHEDAGMMAVVEVVVPT